MRHGLPPAAPGMRVGLLGGSFDPPHEGHRRITLEALKRFRLDRVWWLVSPGNPLKPHGPAPLQERITASRALIGHPRVIVTDIEARLGTRHTARTLARLRPLYPGVRFVWLMGADNLASFHLWEDWRGIAATVPLGVMARPGGRIAAGLGPAAQALSRRRLPEAAAGCLARRAAPAWTLVNFPMSPASSSALRARRP